MLTDPTIKAQDIPPVEMVDVFRNINTETEYGGLYNTVDGAWLVLMRRVLEGKITNKNHIMQIEEGFADEFPESAIEVLKQDIADEKEGYDEESTLIMKGR